MGGTDPKVKGTSAPGLLGRSAATPGTASRAGGGGGGAAGAAAEKLGVADADARARSPTGPPAGTGDACRSGEGRQRKAAMKSESQFLSLAQARPAAPRLPSIGKGRPASGNTAWPAQGPPPGGQSQNHENHVKTPPRVDARTLDF